MLMRTFLSLLSNLLAKGVIPKFYYTDSMSNVYSL